jgi:hypothetical protein
LVENAFMALLRGSVDEYEPRARIRRLVARGRTVDDPAHAQVAVDLARESLATLPRTRRLLLLGAPVWLAFGALQIVSGNTAVGIIVASVAPVSLFTGLPMLGKVRARLERAVRDNQLLADSSAKPEVS